MLLTGQQCVLDLQTLTCWVCKIPMEQEKQKLVICLEVLMVALLLQHAMTLMQILSATGRVNTVGMLKRLAWGLSMRTRHRRVDIQIHKMRKTFHTSPIANSIHRRRMRRHRQTGHILLAGWVTARA